MDPVALGIGIAAGLAVGGGIAFTIGKGKVTELEDRLDKLDSEKDKASKQLKAGQAELKKAKDEAGKLKNNLDKSKKSLKDAESAKKKQQEVSKKLESKAKEVEGKAKALASKAEQAESEAAKLAKEAAEKEAQVSQLKEDLKKAGNGVVAKYDDVQGDLDGILKVLCEHEQQEAAVIADQNGIVVAAFGNAAVKEGMAAAANRITKISDQLKGMVDFSKVSTFRISDAGNKVIAGRTFDIAGEQLALATVGENMPSDGSLDGAMQNLESTLGD